MLKDNNAVQIFQTCVSKLWATKVFSTDNTIITSTSTFSTVNFLIGFQVIGIVFEQNHVTDVTDYTDCEPELAENHKC